MISLVKQNSKTIKSDPSHLEEYERNLVKFYKLQTILCILKDSLQNPIVSSNKILREFLLLNWMPKVHPNLQEPNQKILTITSLPAKEFVTLRNYLHQQILLFCEPLITSNKLLLKQYPNTFDKTFTREEEINVLVERRKSLISAILDAKKRKCEMLTRLLEMRISEENLADQETMLLKFRVKEVKAKIIKLSIHKSIENEGSHTVAAYQEVEKHLNKLLSSRGLTA